MLEPSLLSNEYPLCFGAKIRNMYTLEKTHFHYIKVGYEGYLLHGYICMMYSDAFEEDLHPNMTEKLLLEH